MSKFRRFCIYRDASTHVNVAVLICSQMCSNLDAVVRSNQEGFETRVIGAVTLRSIKPWDFPTLLSVTGLSTTAGIR